MFQTQVALLDDFSLYASFISSAAGFRLGRKVMCKVALIIKFCSFCDPGYFRLDFVFKGLNHLV